LIKRNGYAMALKDWIDTGKCLVGFHEGDWLRENSRSCVLLQTCARCGNRSQRVEHDWPEWRYSSPKSCNLARTCNRCAENESQIEHQWGAWTYRRDGECQQSIPCTRCSTWDEQCRVEHDWGSWEYNEQYRAPLHRCSRCSLLAGYFPDQHIESTTAAGNYEISLATVRELLSDDNAIEEILQRAQAQASSTATPPPQAVSSDEESGWQEQGLKMLRQMYEEQSRAGIIAPERRPLFNGIFAELDDAIAKPSSSLAEKQINARRLQDAMARLSEALLNPSRETPREKPAAGTRLALIAQLHDELFRYVYNETAGGTLTGEEGKTGMGLLGQLRDCREAIADLSPDGDPLKIEWESLRLVALEIRNYSLRHHLTLIQPIWPTHIVEQNPGAIFFSGGTQASAWLEPLCAGRKLHLLIPQPGREPASQRWNQLREAALGVFDFTGFKRQAALAEASTVATVAYELGIAMALGRPALIVAYEDQELPFDLDIEAVRLKSNENETTGFALAIDQSLYGLQRSRAGTSVAQSIQHLRAQFSDHGDFRVRQTLASIDDNAVQDPVKARLLIDAMLGYLGAEAPQLASPTWPGSYPNPATKRCFHVTAFGPAWANTTSQVVERACGTSIVYVRGDQVLAPDILRSIWDEICCATHIVVDLTGLNANVALELGIAHTLGRNVMLISQDRQPEQSFRAIAKQRIHHYDVGGDGTIADLAANLKQFLK
jgi:hypothetical protein